MTQLPDAFTLTLPAWFDGFAATVPDTVTEVTDRMALVHRLADRNVAEATGGPFAAGVFERDSGRVVALGANRVVPLSASGAHAEFMAITLAQARVGTWDLGAAALPAHQLVVNWRPCAMCFGSVVWSGVVDLVIAGEGPEVEARTGFDEGPIHPEWRAELAARGITLTVGVGLDGALATFDAYRASGAPVYNSRRGGQQ